MLACLVRCKLFAMRLGSVLGLLAVLLLVAVSGAALAEDSDAKVGEAVPVVKPEEIVAREEEPAGEPETAKSQEKEEEEEALAGEPKEEQRAPESSPEGEGALEKARVLHALSCVDGGEKREWAIKLEVPEGAKRLDLLVPEGLEGDALVIFEFKDKKPELERLTSFGPASEGESQETVHPAAGEGAPQSVSRHVMSLPEGARSVFVFVGLPGEGAKEGVLAGFSQE